MSDVDNDPAPPRYLITGGGTPSSEELAAITVALTPVARAPVEDDAPPSGALSNWAHAAIYEGIGHRTFVAAPDLAAGRFPLG